MHFTTKTIKSLEGKRAPGLKISRENEMMKRSWGYLRSNQNVHSPREKLCWD